MKAKWTGPLRPPERRPSLVWPSGPKPQKRSEAETTSYPSGAERLLVEPPARLKVADVDAMWSINAPPFSVASLGRCGPRVKWPTQTNARETSLRSLRGSQELFERVEQGQARPPRVSLERVNRLGKAGHDQFATAPFQRCLPSARALKQVDPDRGLAREERGAHVPGRVEHFFVSRGTAVCLAVVERNADEGVTWVHSYVSDDKTKTFCVYDAPNPEAIRKTAARNELPVDRITRVRVLDPYFYA